MPLLLTLVLPLISALQTSDREGGAPREPAVYAVPDPATPAACAARRARVAAELGAGLLVLDAGAEPEEDRFHPDDDFYWATGVRAPDSVLVLVATDGKLVRETLYLPAKDERYELWNGPRLAPGEAAATASGIADTRPLEALDADLVGHVGLVGLARGGGPVLASGERAREVLERAGAEVGRPSRLLRAVQVVKDAGEIAATRAAIDITQEALTDALRVAVPGAWEFTAEAELSGGFRTRGAEALAFPSICGSGPNSCHLHYRSNERRLADGDLLVLDVGAKYRHYCADVTRTIPVNGRFSARQREIYTLVWEASRRAAAALRPGATLGEAHEVARQVFLQRFDADQVRKYFPHAVGHGLGLRVHDAPSLRQKLEPGMVVTIEPGLYLAEEELGVRIEDDYLITADGAELLSDDVPSHPDELEAFLAEIRAR